MKMNPLIMPVLLAGMAFATMQPAGADTSLSAGTIKAWCDVGHGIKTAVKLAPDTWSRFNYLASNAVNGMMATKFATAGAKADWQVNAAMGGVGSKAEDELASWLQEIIANGSSGAFSFAKLPANVDVIRTIAAKLRVAVKNNPQMFWNDTDNIQSTKQALAQFADFEKAYEKFAPGLTNACTGATK